MKRYQSFATILLIITLLLSSCGKKIDDNSYNQDLSIEDTVITVFNSLKEGDTTQANYYLMEVETLKNGVLIKGNRLFGDNLDEEDKSFIRQSYSSLSYSNFSMVSEDENSAIVNLDITLGESTSNVNLMLDKSEGYWRITMDRTFLATMSPI